MDDGRVGPEIGGRGVVADGALLHDVTRLAASRVRGTFCSTSRMATPSRWSASMMSRISATIRGISPSVGSSRRMILGSSIMARAMASICCSPPDRVPPAWPRRSRERGGSSRRPRSRSSCLRASRHPGRSRPVRRFSWTVRSRKMRRSSGTQAMPAGPPGGAAARRSTGPRSRSGPRRSAPGPSTVLRVVRLADPVRPEQAHDLARAPPRGTRRAGRGTCRSRRGRRSVGSSIRSSGRPPGPGGWPGSRPGDPSARTSP